MSGRPAGHATTLVAGGTGFVGRRVVHDLAARGDRVRVMTRSPGDGRSDGVEEVFGDVADPASLRQAFDGVEVAYYLVHSLGQDDFAERDAAGARAFAEQASDAAVRRVVYLGGLGDDHDDLSPHLRSRREVETILAERVETVALRAGIVIGEGSVGWEILCQLVERVPAMITPKWVNTRTQAISLDDAAGSLVDAADPEVPPGHYEIGAPEECTYGDLLRTVASRMGRRRLIVPVPVLSPRLSSWWLRLITDVDLATARTLVDSMTNDVVVTDRRFDELTGRQPQSLDVALASALADRYRR